MRMPELQELRGLSLLRPIDHRFAESMCDLADERRPELLLAAAMTSARLGEGHVCLELETLSGNTVRTSDNTIRRFPSLAQWTEAIASSPLVSDGSKTTPLVLEAGQRLYLRRYWLHERFLARSIVQRARPIESDADEGSLQGSLMRLFGDTTLAEDHQRMAALMAARRQFSVVSGGPGTGKTFTVVKILALLVEQAFAEGSEPPRMTLVAPTGKAAARLVESIQSAKQRLDCEQEVKDAIAEEASTIHRALGSFGASATRFRYHADNPMVTDLVLVDEASMVNVALMSRLMAAVPDHARVILLGDRDQLASVEAGAVLGDICNAGDETRRSRVLVREVEELCQERLPLASNAPLETGIWDCVTHLSKSYRYREGSGIEALALAINAGDSERAISVLRDPGFADVTLASASPRGRLSEALVAQLMRGYSAFLEASDPASALAALSRFRILCAHHRGQASVSAMNELVARHLQGLGKAQLSSEHYHGRPLMIGVNDYDLRLFNGDLGVIMNAEGQPRAFFESSDGLRSVAPARLPAHESVYAMSIHKSQGSEFDDIAVLLPAEMSPVLSRELIYTAVTRAKTSLAIYASEEVLAECIAKRTRRSSGLRALLWGVEDEPESSPQPLSESAAAHEPSARQAEEALVPAAPPEPPSPVGENLVPLETPALPEAPAQPVAAAPVLMIQEATAPVTSRPRARRKKRLPKVGVDNQLAFNLDGAPAKAKPPRPQRQRQAMKRVALSGETASCCGDKSAALLRCPRCAHIWVECCTC